MKKIDIQVLLAGLLIFSASCTSMKRYSSLSKSDADSSLANITLFGSRLSQAAPGSDAKNLWNMSADAQSQFIKILDSRFPDNEKFINSLNNEYLKEKKEPGTTDYVKKDLRLVFSVSKKRGYNKGPSLKLSKLSPADRIEYLRITLTLKDKGLSFKGWNMYTTEYGSVDIGDVSFNKSLDITTSASTPKNETNPKTALTSEAKASFSRKEDQEVKYRYIKLNGRLNERGIEMEEEGTREIDLTGNIIADVILEFDKAYETLTTIEGLKDSSGDFNPPEKISLKSMSVSVPDIKKKIPEIRADLGLDFVYRNVRKGRKTFPEWDDRVKYYTGHRDTTVTLFTSGDYIPGFCCIGWGNGKDTTALVSIERENGTMSPLIFNTYEEASDFYLWLIDRLRRNEEKPLIIDKGILRFNKRNLTYNQIKKDKDFRVVLYYW
jgi:hypothetical protein